MGVEYSLHLIEPTKFARVVAELKSYPFACVPDVEEYLDRHKVTDGTKRQWIANAFSDLFDTQDADWTNSVYNEVLAIVVTEMKWDLAKSLNPCGLEKPLAIFPALKPLRFLISLNGWNAEPPEELRSDSGLYGIWSAAFLESACETVDRFATPKDAQEYAQTVKWSLLDCIRRRPARAEKALATWLDYWVSWQNIRAAIKETGHRGWSLGYGMCP